MPSKEYYRKLKKEAHDLYVREGMTCKEISTRINVSERSVSSWINENDALWKKERQASVISSQKQGDNLKQIINILADQKLELLRMIDEAIAEGDSDKVLELRKQAATLDNSVAQWSSCRTGHCAPPEYSPRKKKETAAAPRRSAPPP